MIWRWMLMPVASTLQELHGVIQAKCQKFSAHAADGTWIATCPRDGRNIRES